MAYDDDPIIEYDYPYDENSENESQRKGCVILLSILIIVAMIGVSLPALFWLYSLRPDPASSERAVTIVEVTREVTKEVTATAIPPQLIEVPVTATPLPIVENGSINRIAERQRCTLCVAIITYRVGSVSNKEITVRIDEVFSSGVNPDCNLRECRHCKKHNDKQDSKFRHPITLH